MNPTETCQKGDILINFRDMLRYILRRWYVIVIGVLVTTALAVGYRYVKDYRAYQARLNNQEQITELTDAQMANAGIVLNLQKAYQTQVRYNNESLLMQLDPTAVHTGTLNYVIAGTQSYATALLYQKTLAGPELYAAVAAAAGLEDKASYIAELITVSVDSNNTAQAQEDRTVLNIRVIAGDDDTCRNITKVLIARMEKMPAVLTAGVGRHTCTLVQEHYATVSDAGIKSTQQSNINSCNTLRTNLKSSTDALSSAEKAYVEAINKEQDSDAETAIARPRISKKYFVLGFGGGLVLFVFIFAVAYLADKKLKSADDFGERYGLYQFGSLTDDSAEALAAIIGRQLVLTAARAGYAGVCAASNVNADALTAAASVAAVTQKSGLPLTLCGDVLTDADAVDTLAAADAVVLVEKIGVSRYDDITRERELCARLDKPVLGVILIA